MRSRQPFTTADKLRVTIEEKNQTAEGREWLAAGKLVVAFNYNEKNMRQVRAFVDDVFIIRSINGNNPCAWPTSLINEQFTIPAPPKPAKLNSEIVEVGQVWKHPGTSDRTILAFSKSKRSYAYENENYCREWGCVVDLNNGNWQLKTPAPVKTLADMGIKRGAKFLYGGNEYTIDFLHATQNQGNTMCHCYSFDKMTLVKPEVEG